MDVSHIALAQVTISVAKTNFEISSKPTLRVPSGGSQMRQKRTMEFLQKQPGLDETARASGQRLRSI
jgi:hypothetical protein